MMSGVTVKLGKVRTNRSAMRVHVEGRAAAESVKYAWSFFEWGLFFHKTGHRGISPLTEMLFFST